MKKNNNNNNSKSKTKQGGNYDWFQNGSAKSKQNKSPKEKFMGVLKIIKILVYVSLAALSLTGCVQSFVISSGSYTGQGMELYTNKEDVAPHVITYEVDTKKGSVTLNSKANYWLSDKKELKDVHAKIKKDGGDITTWKTENNAAQIIVDGKVLVDGKATDSKHITYVGGQPLVYSQSSGKKSGFESYAPVTKAVKMWAADPTNKDTLIPYDITLSNKTASSTDSFQVVVFDQIYNTLQNSQVFKDANALAASVKTKTKIVKKGTSEYDKVVKYQSAVNTLINNTKVGPVDAKGEISTKFSAAKNFTSFHDGSNPSPLGFNLGNKTKLRAIYNWDRAWVLGPFYGLFIYPLSRITLAIVDGLPMLSGWESLIAIALVTIIIRTFAYALTFKSTLQQVKQQELNAKKAAIEAKYEQYKGNKQMEQRKRQELSEMFKKEGVSPLGSIGSIFLTMPLFLAMWKIIGGIAHLKSTTWLGINFAQTSYKELFSGSFQYLPLMLTAATIQGISLYIPRLLTKRRDKNRINAHQKAALKKANKTQNIMMAVFVFMALIFTAGLQIYWIFGGLFTIGQNILNHHIIKWQSKRNKNKRIKASSVK